MSFDKRPLLRAMLGYFSRCPTRTRLRWGRVLGWLAPRLLRSRAHVVQVNLRLCFPDASPAERAAIARRHFRLLAQSFIDRGLCWFGTPQRILDTIEVHGGDILHEALARGTPLLLFTPHFVGIDAAATRLTYAAPEAATLYTRQSDPDVDEVVRQGRARFNRVHLVERHEGVRGLIRHLRKGLPVYYLPDMDFGRKGSAFIPFFGVPAATLLSAAQIARAWHVTVMPIFTRLDPDTGQYHVQILPAVQDFPGDQTPEVATARLNALIEREVRRDPAQYYWVHRRFKTRPEGEAGFY